MSILGTKPSHAKRELQSLYKDIHLKMLMVKMLHMMMKILHTQNVGILKGCVKMDPGV